MRGEFFGRWAVRPTTDPTLVSPLSAQLPAQHWPYVIDMPHPGAPFGRTGAAVAAHPDGPDATLRFARLLAAANRLLDACEAAEAYLGAMDAVQQSHNPFHAYMRRRLRDAIEAAGGDTMPEGTLRPGVRP